MQVLAHEKLWAAKRWLSWRNFYEYLTGTLWWLEGVATLFVFIIPLVVMFSGAQTSTATPLAFATAFVSMFLAADVGHQAAVPRAPALADRLRAPDLPGPDRHLLPVVAAHPADPHLRGHARRPAPTNGSGAGSRVCCWS